MLGKCKHAVEVVNGYWDNWGFGKWVERDPFVFMDNDDDSFYWQGFETREEVDEFIKKLEAARDKAFGEAPTSDDKLASVDQAADPAQPNNAAFAGLPPLDPNRMLTYDLIRYVSGWPESYVKEYATAYALSLPPAKPSEALDDAIREVVDWLDYHVPGADAVMATIKTLNGVWMREDVQRRRRRAALAANVNEEGKGA